MTRRPSQSSSCFIAASLAAALVAGGLMAQPSPAQAGVAAYTVCDFIDNRIDVDAQYALTIMVQRGGTSRSTGLAIFTAIKTGRLEGIYQQNRGKPALLAQRHGSTWWTMLGDDVAKMMDWETPPMLVYKKSLGGASNRVALANALEAAWNAHPVSIDRSKTPAPKGGSCSKPPPPPPPPPPPEKKEKKRRPCPPGTVLHPNGDICIVGGGGSNSECTDAEMNSAFGRQKEFCAGVKTGLDLACSLGTNVCDIGGPPAKLACSVYEEIFGKPPPATKPPECNLSNAQFYRQCIVSTVIGETSQMACFPGTPAQVGRKYDRWSGRVR